MEDKILNKITFLLPTCEPDEMFKWLLPSLKNIQIARDYINFAICFQPPYTEIEINKVLTELDNLHFEYKYFYKDYKIIKPYTPLIRMRNECAMLYPNSLIYGLLDDDMSFDSELCGGDILEVLYQFNKDSEVVVACCKPVLRGPFQPNCFATDSGIFYRGGIYYGFEGLMPENLYQFKNIKNFIPNYNNENILELFGGYQDKFCAMVRILNNIQDRKKYLDSVTRSVRIIYSSLTRHIQNRKARGADAHGWRGAEELEGSISSFILKYINKDFLNHRSMTLFNCEQLNLTSTIYDQSLIKDDRIRSLIRYIGINKFFEYKPLMNYIKYLRDERQLTLSDAFSQIDLYDYSKIFDNKDWNTEYLNLMLSRLNNSD